MTSATYQPIGPVRRGPRSVLGQARDVLTDAAREPLAADRFRLAHLAALRATAALLELYAGPPTAQARRRPTSAWVLLEAAAPHLACWAQLFAAGARKRAAADAGAFRSVSEADAMWQLAAAQQYLDVVSAEIAARADAPPELPLAG